MNLYKITNGVGEFYSIAKDYGEAQHNVETLLDKEDYGFYVKRKALNIELIATGVLGDNFPTLIINN